MWYWQITVGRVFWVVIGFYWSDKRHDKNPTRLQIISNVFIYKSACQTSLSYLPRKDPRDVHRRVVGFFLMLHTSWGLLIYTQRVNRWFAQVPLALIINLLYTRTVCTTLSSMLNNVLCFNAKQCTLCYYNKLFLQLSSHLYGFCVI